MTGYERFTVGVLDHFRVEKVGHPPTLLEYRKHEELLACLALRARATTPRAEIAAAMWPHLAAVAADNRLHQTTHRIRRQLEVIGLGDDAIVTSGGFIRLHHSLKTDATRFAELCEAVEMDHGAAGETLIARIRGVYGEGLLPGLATPWVREERPKLQKAYERAVMAVAAGPEGVSALDALTAVPTRPTDNGADGLAEYVRTNRPRLLTIADGMDEAFYTIDRERWFRTVEHYMDDIRSTIDWAIEVGEHEIALDLAGRFSNHWSHAGKEPDGRRIMEYVLARSGERGAPAVRARVLEAAAVFAALAGEHDIAAKRITEALDLTRSGSDTRALGSTIHNAGLVAEQAGDLDHALTLQLESLEIHRRGGHTAYETKRLTDLAWTECCRGNSEAAHAYLDTAAERVGNLDTWLDARILERRVMIRMGEWYVLDRESIEARALLRTIREEARTVLEVFTRCGSVKERSHAARFVGVSHQWAHEYVEATEFYELAERLAVEIGDMGAAGNAIREQGDVAADQGDIERAIRLIRQSIAMLSSHGERVGLAKSEKALADLEARGYVGRGPEGSAGDGR